jgi:hypothetical protein
MKQNTVKTQRRNYLSSVFDQLSGADQQYLDTLSAQLAEIHSASPQTRLTTGNNAETVVQQDKGKNP